VLICQKYVRKIKEMKKKTEKRWYGLLFSGPSKKAHAPPQSLYPSTKSISNSLSSGFPILNFLAK
jgi:hypothetical protein